MNRTHRTARPLQAFLLTTGLTVSAVSAQAQLAYVSSEKDNALAIVDVKTQSVVGHIPTCKRLTASVADVLARHCVRER